MNLKNSKDRFSVQKIISIILIICFALSIIPFLFQVLSFLYYLVILLLLTQIVISFIGKSDLNVFIELVILTFTLLVFIPILGILIKLVVLGILVFEFMIFSDKKTYNSVKKSFDKYVKKFKRNK
jgi:hypothetical protein